MFHMIWSFQVKALPSSYSQLNETTFAKTTVFCEGFFFSISHNKVHFEDSLLEN